MCDIETLVPQRYPFLFVDEIISADIHEIIGVKRYDKAFLYAQDCSPVGKTIPSVVLIESMVQCGGAGVTQLGLLKKRLWGLASLENVHFGGVVQPGTTVKMVVKNLKVSNKILKQTGKAFVGDEVVLEATWLCLLLK
jgi:3-hydroxymyristoyl/3-hydroxydecanoyl-(acyl carrier protein) dehydratases